MEKGKVPKQDIKAAYRTAYLVAAFLKSSLTPAEKEELEQWIAESDHNKNFFAELTNPEKIGKMRAEYEETDTAAYLQRSKEKLSFHRPTRTTKSGLYIAAAAIAALVIVFFLWQPFTSKPVRPVIAAADSSDLLPGTDRAVLTTGNGKRIELRHYENDTVLDKTSGLLANGDELAYTGHEHTNMNVDIEYHTLSVPRQGTYKLKLPDGTLVWLNAESSIRYPTAFAGHERSVSITGEAYFEVVHNSKIPFKVIAGKSTIEELGTSFNVNAYADEPVLKASLLEGSISASVAGTKGVVIKPLQEAVIKNNKVIIRQADLDEALAWKNDQFHFSNTPVESILRQVARWYDTEIIYRDSISTELTATIGRNVTVSRLLNLLSKTGEVHFKVEGKKIIVTK